MLFWSRPTPLMLWFFPTFQVQRSLTGRSRYASLAHSPFPRTRIVSTRGVAVLCIFSFGWVSWHGVYLIFLQLQQLPSASCPRGVTWWFQNDNNIEESIYLHEVWPQVQERKAVKKMRLECFFWNQYNTLPSTSSLVFCFLTLRLHLSDCDFDARPLFLIFLFPLCTHIHIYNIVTIIVCYISWYWQNRHRPEIRLKRLL